MGHIALLTGEGLTDIEEAFLLELLRRKGKLCAALIEPESRDRLHRALDIISPLPQEVIDELVEED